jgi:chromosome segregation ATPase
MIGRPGFEIALRGYDKRQVDQYVAKVDSEIAALVADRTRSFGQIQELVGKLQKLQGELTELQQRPPQIERASFRHLGPMVDQILALSEKQAEAIIAGAAERASHHQAKADRMLVEAREQADGLRAQGDATREEAEKEAARLKELGAQQIEQTRSEVEAMVQAARAQVQQEAEATRTQTQQELTQQVAAHQQQLASVLHEIEGRQKVVSQLRTEMDAFQQRLVQTRQEGVAAERELHQIQHHLGEVNGELTVQLNRLEEAKRAADAAERHAKDVRARVQREAERVANLAAAAVMAAAQRGAETGEYPQVTLQPRGDEPAGEAAAPEPPADANGHFRREADPLVPAQREPQSQEAAQRAD